MCSSYLDMYERKFLWSEFTIIYTMRSGGNLYVVKHIDLLVYILYCAEYSLGSGVYVYIPSLMKYDPQEAVCASGANAFWRDFDDQGPLGNKFSEVCSSCNIMGCTKWISEQRFCFWYMSEAGSHNNLGSYSICGVDEMIEWLRISIPKT